MIDLGLRVKQAIPYLSDNDIERDAAGLLAQCEEKRSPLLIPPVPIDYIAEFVLQLEIIHLPIDDDDKAPILAFIDGAKRRIVFNEQRETHFHKFAGTYEFTLAHEIGHFQLHFETATEQSGFNWGEADTIFICRYLALEGDQYSRHEYQANRYASSLLMPYPLIDEAASQFKRTTWSDVKELAKQFSVSTTAMKIRLQALNLLYIDGNTLYPSKEAAIGQSRLF